jgi:hypothetical protein
MLKKTIIAALCATAISLPIAAQTITTELDGRRLYFEPAPMMVGGRIMVPLRGIFESLGAQVTFESTTQTIQATRGQRVVRLSLGSRVASIDGRQVMLDTPASTLRGNTIVPLRFVSEALGNEVRWSEATRTVSLSSMAGQSPVTSYPNPNTNPIPNSPLAINSVIHNARNSVKQGDRLIVTVNGAPGCQGTFEVLGVGNSMPLREVNPGSYRGEMVVLSDMRVEQGTLVATLRKNGQEVSKQSDNAVSLNVAARNQNGSQYAGNSGMQPANGSQVNNARPTITAGFGTRVNTNSARLYVDGLDVTSASRIQNNRLTYVPNNDLSQGNHSISAQATDTQGRAVRRDWNFQVSSNSYNSNTQNGNYNNGSLEIRFSNLTSGASVPAVFNVQGQTTPGAAVHVTGQSQRSLVPGFLNLPNRTLDTRTTADANGHFDVQLDASSIAVGSVITVEIQANDSNGRTGNAQRLDVTRR